ncbi:MAG TPA: transporter substrate-binding domain-containing protein [Hydrogenophaga sp.]|uniref:transporter substrate-binding domain-containing protein n=1 Tax=Hydrogenophaga sp. TaxID=1904254 RepID=UPI002CBD32FA|nr:transporter substrate-binding domain-containing protein [Hydrogenophaga sp.]HSX94069.1 transporter substrate-binding domain-containing protein [Hydrogenophaga sp.]
MIQWWYLSSSAAGHALLALALLLAPRLAGAQELVVGVKTDFAPFGSLDGEGQPVGFEADLARRLGQVLGRPVRLSGVSTENRFQRLQQGSVHLLIATVGDTRERRSLGTAVEPHYYAGAVNVLLPPDSPITDWAGVRGRTLCALQGAYFNRAVEQRFLATLQTYRSVRDAQLALRSRRCAGFVYTEVALQHLRQGADWPAYRLLPTAALQSPWAVYLPRNARGSELERRIGDALAQWHRDGSLIELERRWGLPPSGFLQAMQARWNGLGADGQPACQRDARGEWPIECRDPAFITAEEMPGVRSLGYWLRDTLDLDMSVVYDPFDGARFARGVGWSLLLCAASMALALAVAWVLARGMLARSAAPRRLCLALAGIERCLPLLLQMYFVYFGLGNWLAAGAGWTLPPLPVAVWCLGVYHGTLMSYMLVDASRAAAPQDPVSALRPEHWPALAARAGTGLRVVMNNLTKATIIASAIAVPEMLAATLSIVSDRGNALAMMNLLLVTGFAFTAFWSMVIGHSLRRLAARSA